MFGFYRTTLAMMVMVHHLFVPNLLGPYAVFGFYILSGYLMTLIMHRSYGYHWYGRFSFAINRGLRLFPMYWASAIITIVLIYIIGSGLVREYHKSMFLPQNLESIIKNILMIFPAWYPYKVIPRLVPTAWALTVEIFFYFLICVGISKNIFRVRVWLCISWGYLLMTFILGYDFVDRYVPIAAASLPFSLGSLLYFLTENMKLKSVFTKTYVTNSLFIVMIVNTLTWMIMSYILKNKSIIELGFYLNILINFFLIYSIIIGGKISFISKRMDNFIGNLSYPIYLTHWQVGLFVSFSIFGKPLRGHSLSGLTNLIVSMVVIILLSIFLVNLVDHPIQNIRRKIKANQNARQGFTKRS